MPAALMRDRDALSAGAGIEQTLVDGRTAASVVICTHNPRDAYLARVLAALREQTLDPAQWELIVVDNASTTPLAGRCDIGWHPAGRLVREEELGLTPARLRGISEARGDLLIFVDDDNVLASDYLERATAIGASHPFLGAWGAGIVEPEFEAPPAAWAAPHLPQLALRSHAEDRWSNDVSDWPATPVGAGMCLRREVARRYARDILSDAGRARLDRRGGSLDGAGDLDMAYTARHFSLGWGTFVSLRLLHLIPAVRTSRDYLLRITEAAHASLIVMGSKVGRPIPPRTSGSKRLAMGILALLRGGPSRLRFFLATERGKALGLRRIDPS